MKYRRVLLALVFASLFDNKIAAQQSLLDVAPSKLSSVPFRLKSGFLIEIEGRIGPLDGLRFVLDTGATHSVLNRKIAARFPRAAGSRNVVNFDRFVSVDWAAIPDVRMGSVTMNDVSMMVADLKNISPFLDDTDAVIGLDLLARLAKIRVFYDSKLVVLEPRAYDEHRTSAPSPGCFTVPVTAQGQRLELAFDTGMSGILLYEDRIRKRTPQIRLTHEKTGAHLGWLQGKTARLPGFRLLAAESDPDVFLINGPRESLLPGLDGFLGTGPLKAKRIEMDFQARTLRWE